MIPYPNKAIQAAVSTKPNAIMAAGQIRGKSLSVAAFCVTGANQVLVCMFGYRRGSVWQAFLGGWCTHYKSLAAR